eukprot:195727-Ditylum_brightwellii.AAC.1
MLCSMYYIHFKGIIYCNLNLENFLFSNDSPDSELKIITFRLSKHFKFGEEQHEAIGMPYNVMLKVICGSYNEPCDLFISTMPSATTPKIPKPTIYPVLHSIHSLPMSAMSEYLCPSPADDELE